MKYLAYFQSYTNTYDNLKSLATKYEEALAYPGVVGLIVGTRPDCVSDELLDYFDALNKHVFLLIEYGVESTLNKTLERVNRQHTYEDSIVMIRKTAERGIPVGAHIILGLPGESDEEVLSHATRLSQLPLTSLKIHQLQIIRHTAMAKEFMQSPESFRLFGVEEYVDLCVSFAEHLNPAFILNGSPLNHHRSVDCRNGNKEP